MDIKTVDTNNESADSLLASVSNDLRKSEKESIKAKLKEILKKKLEAEKTIRLLDLEARKIVDDFNAGI